MKKEAKIKIDMKDVNLEEYKKWCEENGRELEKKMSLIMFLSGQNAEMQKIYDDISAGKVKFEDIEVYDSSDKETLENFKTLLKCIAKLGGTTDVLEDIDKMFDEASEQVLKSLYVVTLESSSKQLADILISNLKTLKGVLKLKEALA